MFHQNQAVIQTVNNKGTEFQRFVNLFIANW